MKLTFHPPPLAGAGESGKSTIFKQMKINYGKGFSLEERKGYAQFIYDNIITSMRSLIEAVEEVPDVKEAAPQGIVQTVCRARAGRGRAGVGAGADNVSYSCTQDAKDAIVALPDNAEVNEEIGNHIKDLWSDPAIQSAYELRAKFQLNDSCK